MKISEDGVFYGKTILFTGTLQTGRKEAEELAAKSGAKYFSCQLESQYSCSGRKRDQT
ncbi:MAG: hypothetical protein IPJ13_10630 [Saprospiraceae bacterium]|nr:hypothetical protein [Saprospiraceae bacterium]